MTTTGRSLRAFSITAVAVGATLLVGGIAYAVRGGVAPSTAAAATPAPTALRVHGHAGAMLRRLAAWKAPAVPAAQGTRSFAGAPRVVTITVPAGDQAAPEPTGSKPAPPPTQTTTGDDTSDDTADDGAADDSASGGGE
jgi:hypothetical protein